MSAIRRRWCFSGESAVHWCGESVMCRQYGVGGVLVVSQRYIGGEPVMCRQCSVGGALVVSRRYIGGESVMYRQCDVGGALVLSRRYIGDESVMYRQCGDGGASVVCRRWRLAFSKKSKQKLRYQSTIIFVLENSSLRYESK